MASRKQGIGQKTAYGPGGEPVFDVFPGPVITDADPTSSNYNYPVGQVWVNYSTDTVWQLTSKSSGAANWSALGSGTTGAIVTITGDSGGPEVPSGGNFSILGTANQVAVTGGANKETISLIGPYTPATYTAHGVLVGQGTSSIAATATGTAGQMFVSGGAAADPLYKTPTSADSSITWSVVGGAPDAVVANPIQVATVTLTSAEILALRATPIQIIAAPAAGKTISILKGQLKLVYGGTNAFTNPQDLALKYTDGSGVAVSSTITGTGFIDQTANTYTSLIPAANAIVAATGAEAQAIVIHNTGGSEITGNAAGDNTVVVTVEYQVLTQ